MDMHRIDCGVEAKVVGGTPAHPGFHTTTGHPNSEGVRVMVSTPAWTILDVALNEWCATELTTPNDEGVVEHPAHLQVLDEPGAGLIGILALGVQLGGEAVVLIPTGVHALHKAHPSLGQAARHEAVVSERTRLAHLRAVQVQHVVRFVGKIGQLRHGCLHLVRHLVLGDARANFRVASLLKFYFVQLSEIVQQTTAQARLHAGRVFQVQHRVATATKLGSLKSGRQKTGPPVEIIKNLATACALADGGHRNKTWQILGRIA